jgi:protein-S-isoprenylcysteine O-methyltransferase Ste14
VNGLAEGRTRAMPHIAWLVLGAGLNLAVLLLPAIATGQLADIWADSGWLLFLALATGFCLGDLATMRQPARIGVPADGRIERQARRLSLATGLLNLTIFWTASLEHLARAAEPATELVWIGAALMALGSGLRCMATCTLGRFFSSEITVQPDQPFVECGVYRYVRHPSETGLLAVVLGACLVMDSLFGLLFWAILFVPFALWRLRYEERCLVAGFGDRYRLYSLRVKRLIPFIY